MWTLDESLERCLNRELYGKMPSFPSSCLPYEKPREGWSLKTDTCKWIEIFDWVVDVSACTNAFAASRVREGYRCGVEGNENKAAQGSSSILCSNLYLQVLIDHK